MIWVKNLFKPPYCFLLIPGHPCCNNMFRFYQIKTFNNWRNFAMARSFHEANTFIIIGCLSQKMANYCGNILNESSAYKRIIHFSSCENSLQNKYIKSELSEFFSTYLNIKACKLSNNEIIKQIREYNYDS